MLEHGGKDATSTRKNSIGFTEKGRKTSKKEKA